MAGYSERELVAHAVRRLGMGANPWLAARAIDADEAIARCLDLGGIRAEPPVPAPPASWEELDYEFPMEVLVPWWLDEMVAARRPLAERLVWFWHDHFATDAPKVDNPYLTAVHHATLRRHATGSFAELLRAVAADAGMLAYLDALDSSADAPNENLARELMELHTLGVGSYAQTDVTEVARAATGYRLNEPHWERDGFVYEDAEPWSAVLDPSLHDGGPKRILGRMGRFDLGDVVEILLEHPATARHVAAEMFTELVGLPPDRHTTRRLGDRFRRDYEIVPLVEEIVAGPDFLSREAVRAKYRTPLEKAVTLLQAFGTSGVDLAGVAWQLASVGYLPLEAPNPAGFPKGPGLLGPYRLLFPFSVLAMLPEEPEPPADPFEALGLYDVSGESRRVAAAASPHRALVLAAGSPEFALT